MVVDFRRIAAVAERQGGVVRRETCFEAGADRSWLLRRRRDGTLVDCGCGVLALGGAPDTPHRRRWFALLAAGDGSHLSHEAAAELHHIRGVRRGLVVVTVGHPLHLEIPGVVLHQLADVEAHHLTVVDGLPVTTPARTIVDLAAILPTLRLATAVEHVVVERLATLSQLADVLREVRRRGKPGVRKLVRVLEARDGEPVPESKLEHLLLEAAARAGVPVVRQYPLPWAEEPVLGLVDAAVPSSRLLLEADGRSWHARYQAMARDRRRDVEAARAGWLTLRFVHDDLVDVRAVARAIAEVHRSRVSA